MNAKEKLAELGVEIKPLEAKEFIPTMWFVKTPFGVEFKIEKNERYNMYDVNYEETDLGAHDDLLDATCACENHLAELVLQVIEKHS